MAKFSAPISEKMEDELIYAIRREQDDADRCHTELLSRGWTVAQITARVLRLA